KRFLRISQLLFGASRDVDLPELALLVVLLEHINIVAQALSLAFEIGRRVGGEEIDRGAVRRPCRDGATVDRCRMARQWAGSSSGRTHQKDLLAGGAAPQEQQRLAVRRPPRQRFAGFAV